MSLPETHADLLAEVDALLRECPEAFEAPTDASDIAAELNRYRIPADQRITERPGAEWEWNR